MAQGNSCVGERLVKARTLVERLLTLHRSERSRNRIDISWALHHIGHGDGVTDL